MKDPQRDIRLHAALRTSRRAPAPTPAEVSALSKRIARAAGPVLLRKRHPARSAFEYIVSWTGALLPLGLACTFAGAIALVLRPAPRESEATPAEAILNAASNSITTPQLVDIVLREPEGERAEASAARRLK